MHSVNAGNVGLSSHAEEKVRLEYTGWENLAYLWKLSNVGQVRKMIMTKRSHAEQSRKCVNQCGTRSLLVRGYKGEYTVTVQQFSFHLKLPVGQKMQHRLLLLRLRSMC